VIAQATSESINAEVADLTAAQIRAALAAALGQERGWVASQERGDSQARVYIEGDGEVILDGESGWLGVTPVEVSQDRAKELKLSAARGVYLDEVEKDSPAEKAGLKSGDVITEFNGQRVEGVAQFRRLVRETPSGHTVSITVWRDGKSQTVTATLGDGEGQFRAQFNRVMPRMNLRVAPMPAMPHMPDMENFTYNLTPRVGGNFMVMSRTPMLGISAEDLSGQLGSYFGAPDGQGVLVREVNSGSPAEKSGMKAGDVITKIAGDRVKSLSEMQSKLRDKREEKTIQVTVLRKGSETTLTVEPTKPPAPAAPRVRTRPASRPIA
jgi:serine protease Do